MEGRGGCVCRGGSKLFFLYFESYAKDGDGVIGEVLASFFFNGWGILWRPSSLGEYHQSERRGTEQLGRGLVRRRPPSRVVLGCHRVLGSFWY